MVSGGVIAIIVIVIIIVITTVILLIYFLVIKKTDDDKISPLTPLDIKAAGGERGKQIITTGPLTIMTGVSEFINAVGSILSGTTNEAVLKNPLENGNCGDYKLIYNEAESTIKASWLPENNNYLQATGTTTRSTLIFANKNELSKWTFDNFPGTLYKRLKLSNTDLYLYHNPGPVPSNNDIGKFGSPANPKDNILYVATVNTENPNGYTWIVTDPIGPNTPVITCKQSLP